MAALWNGHLVVRRWSALDSDAGQQQVDVHGHLSYHPYANAGKPGFLKHLDPSRLAVPRLQNWCAPLSRSRLTVRFRILLWVIFLVAYTWALQTPDRAFGAEDYGTSSASQ